MSFISTYIHTLSVKMQLIICKVVCRHCFSTECMCLVFSSVSEEAIRSAESRLRQRFPQRSFRLHQSGSDPAGALPLQPGQETPRGAGGRGEGGSDEGVSAGAVSLSAHHRDAGRPAQPQNQHRHQLVPQLQVCSAFYLVKTPRRDVLVSELLLVFEALNGSLAPPAGQLRSLK